MATTLAASAYFLTCCRPIHNSFAFLIEKPKLINFYHYPIEYFIKTPFFECPYDHEKLFDHCLNIYHECTDERAWSLDDQQKRQHFQDLINLRIPHCGPGEVDARYGRKSGSNKRVGNPGESAEETKGSKQYPAGAQGRKGKKGPATDDGDMIALLPPTDSNLPSESSSEENLPEKSKDPLSIRSKTQGLDPSLSSKRSKKKGALTTSSDKFELGVDSSAKSIHSGIKGHPSSIKSEDSKKLGLRPSTSSEYGLLGQNPSAKSVHYEKQQLSSKSLGTNKLQPSQSDKLDSFKKPSESDTKNVVDLTDELIEKLDRNLRNLESTFDKFVKKNRDFIQNLVECLEFEKQKQKTLENDYDKLKQENEELKTQNDYLKMVNNKQLDLFKNELDKGISENKIIYKRRIHLMERQLQNDQNELQMYRQTEKKYMEVVEQDNDKIEKLNKKVDELKNKEVQLVKNYLQLLKFLENVKNILSNADPKEIPQLRSLNTLTDSDGENEPQVKRVLKNALRNGISTLNVRDLSILHDAIEGLNDGLCHQTDKCTKSPTADSSYPDFSTMSIHRLIIEHSIEDLTKDLGGYDTTSNLSIDRIPTRQKPEDRNVSFQ